MPKGTKTVAMLMIVESRPDPAKARLSPAMITGRQGFIHRHAQADQGVDGRAPGHSPAQRFGVEAFQQDRGDTGHPDDQVPQADHGWAQGSRGQGQDAGRSHPGPLGWLGRHCQPGQGNDQQDSDEMIEEQIANRQDAVEQPEKRQGQGFEGHSCCVRGAMCGVRVGSREW